MKLNCFGSWVTCGLLLGIGTIVQHSLYVEAQSLTTYDATQSNRRPSILPAAPHSSISLSPAVAAVKCNLGQSNSQILTITNHTPLELVFEMIAEDVVVRDGNRVFVQAGETLMGIAATAVFTPKEVVVRPEQSSSVKVTFTIPSDTPLRAVVAVFRGSPKLRGLNKVQMTGSLGTLFTFTVSPNLKIETAPLTLTAQSATSNLEISQFLTNTGSEPLVPDGIAAVLDQAGAVLGKAVFEPQRLLPGERLPFQTQYAKELQAGKYRVLASFQYEDKVTTSSIDFTVP
jgi:hypothetical protein